MAKEGSTYGGKIEVQPDKSVIWSIHDRFFPKGRDVDGKIEYAIRVATGKRGVFGSSDGKCLVTVVDPSPAGDYAFLIVSGYATANPPTGWQIMGKEYFITADRYEESGVRSPASDPDDEIMMPTYDLTLRFDDYDLEYAQREHSVDEDLDATELEVFVLDEKSIFMSTSARPIHFPPPDKLEIRLPYWRTLSITAPELHEPTKIKGKIKGARSLSVEGLTRPGSFALMYREKKTEDPGALSTNDAELS